MPIHITMPALSATMESGTLAKWRVKVGDLVKSGDVIAEIETEKATMELEADDSGFVEKLLVSEGAEDVPVGGPIAVLAEVDEADAVPPPLEILPAEEAEEPERHAATGQPGLISPPLRGEVATAPRATPLARRLAEVEGIEISQLRGSGPRGRIVKDDVLRVLGQATASDARSFHRAAAAPPVAPSPGDMGSSQEQSAPEHSGLPAADTAEPIRLSAMRRTIARRLTESKLTAPHFYMTIDVRLDALLGFRAELNAELDPEARLSINDLLIKALALALVEAPDANVQFAGDHLYRFRRADISVAVAVPGGLVTPVLVDAAAKRPSQIAREMKELTARAREGRLASHELEGGTASLSNLGMYGVKQFGAVLNPPQAVILAAGAAEQRPWVADGSVTVATVMSVTGSFDHRALDGAVAAELLGAFRGLVESPIRMLA